MKLKAFVTADVIVMGAGLAGIMAATEAAEKGASVCLVSATKICSGSSFYPGTWGLGLIGPEDDSDKPELEKTINQIGEGMADPVLVHTLVEGISDGIAHLEHIGLKLKKAGAKSEREFIPCFDHKSRAWNGLIQKDARETFQERLAVLGVTCLPDMEIIECVVADDSVKGVIALQKDGSACFLSCKALVIASGGMGGLFQYRLNTDDIAGMGQYLALKAGAQLINIEFMQMMPGFLNPAPKTIYNEKVFRYSDFCYPETKKTVFDGWKEGKEKELLEIRSSHGPFTSRLESYQIDRRLFEVFIKDKRGVKVTYKEEIWHNQPEFIRTYFEWLEKEKHLTVKDAVCLGIFAHASNGGIRIDRHGNTGLVNLFACGEATGGMHGADRLGGLSTANGLVFGRIAGRAAAECAMGRNEIQNETDFKLEVTPKASKYLALLRDVNFKAAMIYREESAGRDALDDIRRLEAESNRELRECLPEETVCFSAVRDTYRSKAAVMLSQCLLTAILLRKESRGSHYRADYPEKDADLKKCILCSYDRHIQVNYQEGWQEDANAGGFYNQNKSDI